jgi:hypothetical protein
MPTPQHLLERLSAIAASLESTGNGLALLGLGSVGLERHRLDDFSDLDFFAIVRPGTKQNFLVKLDWLSAPCTISWCFMNTTDGYKALYSDGIFCEFALFEPQELAGIPYSPGAVVWQTPEYSVPIAQPERPLPTPDNRPDAWHLGEALSNLYVGLCRWNRGERLSAFRFVQSHAVDRYVTLFERRYPAANPLLTDAFDAPRRLEARQPVLAEILPRLMPGYTHTPEAALAMLAELERLSPTVCEWGVHTTISREIRRLAG